MIPFACYVKVFGFCFSLVFRGIERLRGVRETIAYSEKIRVTKFSELAPVRQPVRNLLFVVKRHLLLVAVGPIHFPNILSSLTELVHPI